MDNKNEHKPKDVFLHNLLTSLEREKKRKIFSWLSILIATMTSLSVALTFTIFISDQDNTFGKHYFSKSIKKDIEKVIQNNADIEVVKHIYNNRLIKKGTFLEAFSKKSQEEKYLEGTPLSTILKDILIDYYLTGKNDSIYLKKIKSIIICHNQTNPFDKLESNQKNDFENLRLKLNDKYDLVQNDIIRISDELDKRNQLVDKYLDKSNLSYWVSIIALFATILLSVYQIFQNSHRRFLKLIKSALNSRNESDENK